MDTPPHRICDLDALLHPSIVGNVLKTMALGIGSLQSLANKSKSHSSSFAWRRTCFGPSSRVGDFDRQTILLLRRSNYQLKWHRAAPHSMFDGVLDQWL